MSSFIVEENTINIIVAYLSQNHAIIDGLTTDSCDNLDILGTCLKQMNADAFADRYRETPEPVEQFKFRPVCKTSVYMAYRKLSCFLYQCSEGDVDERPLYKELEQILGGMASYIASHHPRVEEHSWS